jgi:hypothetical protein
MPNKLMQIFESFPSESRMESIARWYDEQPLMPPRYKRAEKVWGALADECSILAGAVRKLVVVSETPDPEPYENVYAMSWDIVVRNFIVSNANCEHPLWTPAENVNFRITHDTLGHFPIRADFTFAGEVRACNEHAGHLSDAAQEALFVECICTTAFRIVNGYFAPPKIALVYL